MRIEAQQLYEQQLFNFRGTSIQVLGVSNKTNLIPQNELNNPFHKAMQYQGVTYEGTQCEIFVYFYTDFYGKQYAVIDAIQFT